MKIVIGDPKTRKSWQLELEKDRQGIIVGKKVGDQLEGELVGAPGYLFELRGGSDSSGFSMRADVAGSGKRTVLLSKGIGFKGKRKGVRKRKTVFGNTYSNEITQVNVKVVKYGTAQLEELFGKKEKEESKEEKKEG